MPAPSLDITHIKTSKQYAGEGLRRKIILRYWLQWSNRRDLSRTVLRLELYDEAGNKATEANLQLPKVKVTGYVPASETSPAMPIYDSAVVIKLDDMDREKPPVSFRYWTVNALFTNSDIVEGQMSGVFDDLTVFE
ncbi:hypothetical protein GCM10028808_73400 [Spirosoma migulaei]